MAEPVAISPFQYRLSLGFSVFLVLMGVALLIFGVSFLRDAYASLRWPSVQGIVKSVHVRRDSTGTRRTSNSTYTYEVTYSYSVSDRVFRHNRYSLGDGPTASRKYSERREAIAAARQQYPIGQTVDVYYDPADPDESILKPGPNLGTFVPLVLGFLFLPSGILFVYQLLRYSPAK